MKILTSTEHFSQSSSERVFKSEYFSSLQSLVNKLDLLNNGVNQALRGAMHKAGNVILKEQRRLADETGVPFLSPAITVGQVKARVSKTKMLPWGETVNSDNVISITIGYHENAFNYTDTARKQFRTHTVSRHGIVHDGDYWKQASKSKPGIIGMTYEFGRPGTSSAHGRNREDMEQVRRIIPNRKEGVKRRDWKEAVPTKIKVRKGRINPTPHIGRGFQNKLEPALGVVIGAVEAEIKKAENG